MLGNPRPAVTAYVAHRINEGTFPSLAVLVRDISEQVKQIRLDRQDADDLVGNTRNDMYLASEAIRFLMKDKDSDLSEDDIKTLNAYKSSLDKRPSSSRPGSRSRWRSRSAWAPWWAGSASS